MENEKPSLWSFFKWKDLFWFGVYSILVYNVWREAGMATAIAVSILFLYTLAHDVSNRMLMYALDMMTDAIV